MTDTVGADTSKLQPVWMRNLQKSLRDRPVAILHGNVRDIYIQHGHGESTVYSGLTDLLRNKILHELSNHVPFSEMVFYAPAAGERRIPLGGSRPQAGALSAADDGILKNTGSSPMTGKPEATAILGAWRQELGDSSTSRFHVLYYLDKFVPYSTNYQPKDRELLLWLEKVIDNISENNRLILVALRDTMIPVELYTNSPKAFVQPIPMPDADDREAYLRSRVTRLDENEKRNDKQFALLGNLTDGLFLQDLENIARAIHSESDLSETNLRRLLNRYRFGDQKDYFAQLSITDIQNIPNWFENTEGVAGQREAIEKVRKMLTIARAGLSGVASGTASKPKGVLFFAGPSGVGKTLVAKKLAKFLFGDETAFLRFDMSEFKEGHTISKLIGSPPGYVGSEEGGMLTNGVREKPFSVVLFDEIEKADPKIMDIFLQILDEGRLTDSRGQTVFFTETIIVFTSNIGTRSEDGERENLERIRNDRDLTDEQRRQKIRDHFKHSVERFFMSKISRPELLNRFGRNIIPFNFIDSLEIQEKMFKSHLARIKGEIEDRHRAEHHTVRFDAGVAAWLARRHSSRVAEFGGRGVVDTIEAEVIEAISDAILGAEHDGRTRVCFNVMVSEEENRIVAIEGKEGA